MEMPECPVCLQTYDGEEVIPRVLPCGHSACSPCIAQLAASSYLSFPDTIRCPACNQVVPCPRARGPDVLPKNIDLLRLCTSSPSSSTSRLVQSLPPERKRVDFFPIRWDEQLFSSWKDWILPFDAISMEEIIETPVDAVAATLKRTSSCGRFEENQSVRLLAVGASSSSVSTSAGCEQLKLSYISRVMEALSDLGEKERVELGFIMAASSGQRRGLCRIFGLWMSPLDGSPLFLVCERFQLDLFCVLDELVERKRGLVSADEVFDFAKLGMELCEMMIDLHSQGMVCGCLAPSCFCFDGYGHCLLDLNEVLVVGRTVRKDVLEIRRRSGLCRLGKAGRFVSPEILRSLHSDHIDSDSGSGVGYESDVWSLACILTVLLVEGGRVNMESSEGGIDDDRVELSLDVYNIWKNNVISRLEASLLSTTLESMLPLLESCLSYDPASRPSASDMWRCIMSLFMKPQCIVPAGSDIPDAKKDLLCCFILGDLCWPPKDGNHRLMRENILEENGNILDSHSCVPSADNRGKDIDHFQQEKADWDLVKGYHGSKLKMVSLQGHHDCITGLAAGGMSHECFLGVFFLAAPLTKQFLCGP